MRLTDDVLVCDDIVNMKRDSDVMSACENSADHRAPRGNAVWGLRRQVHPT
jgi:hypothetical protein